MNPVTAIIYLFIGLVAIVFRGKYLWKLNITSNKGKFIWLSVCWAMICWFLTGNIIFVWPVFVVLSIGFAAYAIFIFSGSVLHRAILSFTFSLPGSVSYILFSPPWPHGWASMKPFFVIGPPLVILAVVTLWFIAKQYTRQGI